MGLMDNLRGFFSGSKNTQISHPQPQRNEDYERSRLAERIVDLVGKIKKVNSFDSSIWNLSNISSYELKRKNLDELISLNSTLENRLSQLTRESQRTSSNRESLERSAWTGQKPKNMNEHDFDVYQRGDDR